jgi:hypothetical protein
MTEKQEILCQYTNFIVDPATPFSVSSRGG